MEDSLLLALQKAKHYCAYQERCHSEVRDKLYSFGLHRNETEPLLTQLIEEGFLNEERFAIAYAGGKFRMKGWGINKIINALKRKNVSAYCINKALKQISPAEYKKTLLKIIEKKSKSVKETDPYKRKYKLAQFAIGKGYEPEQVWEVLSPI